MSRSANPTKNLVGPILRKLRYDYGLTQDEVAKKCQLMGWDIARETILKIESNRRLVADYEIYLLAKALNIPPERLMPKLPSLTQFLQSEAE
jgi:transcriptional regulator with XRE-family HTH domain